MLTITNDYDQGQDWLTVAIAADGDYGIASDAFPPNLAMARWYAERRDEHRSSIMIRTA